MIGMAWPLMADDDHVLVMTFAATVGRESYEVVEAYAARMIDQRRRAC
jgi:hypothetical protein